MSADTLNLLVTWSPYLLQGFLWNVLIAVCAVTLGSVMGGGLAWLRVSNTGWPGRAAERVSHFLRGVPTLALIFYVVFVLPAELTVPGTDITVQIPQWIKAVIGLSASPLSFTSESLVVSYRAWRKGDIGAALLVIPNWINVFLISFVASSASSLVGVSELVSRSNTVIATSAASGHNVMVPVYLYCSLYFVVTSLLFTAAIKKFKASAFMANVHKKLEARHAALAGTA
ncbi:amino acid ABC transporter permease [Pseudoduganella ginsengisoli]|uniref:ABC transporter permease subunit n=1 Tax=Pseudoduganella ginsengisoli TaxID=1462440 RepID=A0A6L6Q358_9BURK|nr:ABC transporter permease subunit [Pseudoduganella ginsengisoli]MTW03731.1 ABC transporter permease subunit [Pseudoduganella ginsengisoli]